MIPIHQSVDKKQNSNFNYVIMVTIIASLGGMMMGYYTNVISGAVGFLQIKFSLSPAMTGWVVSSMLLGCMIGAGFSGIYSERFGLKNVQLLSALFFTVGIILSAFADTVTTLVISRIIGGIGAGITTSMTSLYVSEISPPKIRGRLVSLYQLVVVTGISIVYFVNFWVVNQGDNAWNVSTGWRWMLGLGIIPSLIYLIFIFFIPESPRWLQKRGREDEALKILWRINDEEQAIVELNAIKNSVIKEKLNKERVSIKGIFRPGVRKVVFIGIALGILQVLVGIDTIMYYAPEIFEQTGSGTNSSFMMTVSIGIVNMMFAIVAVWLIDKVGRRKLLLTGLFIMSACHCMIATLFLTGATDGFWILSFILLFVAAFEISIGSVLWVVLGEIFPAKVRGLAMSLAILALWIASFVVTQSFPIILSIGPAIAFGSFAVISIIGFIFVYKALPETKGMTLEEIEQGWSIRMKKH
ncbi:sugar porter family MFS transporter [Peribacillus muralis]|uniref:sugar porter family MFS transporter n=1 Tax=Peribacillus muralis TaxID=264697 RepID=UPI001F4E127F|nr:sugar porter family MFS transporter [Peribacillus muralis]MCK1992928.1 sugar porter family MFS transporter [Peribacillus muralis]MCK2013483.1 sugar porter family MFS transporter [Peribacillus muralis]